MPLLWRDHVIGWANVSVVKGKLTIDTGYTMKKPSRGDATAFGNALEAEVERIRIFLNTASCRLA